MLLLSSSFLFFFYFSTPTLQSSCDGGKMCTKVNQTESQTVHPVLPHQASSYPLAQFGPWFSLALLSARSAEGSTMLSVWSAPRLSKCIFLCAAHTSHSDIQDPLSPSTAVTRLDSHPCIYTRVCPSWIVLSWDNSLESHIRERPDLGMNFHLTPAAGGAVCDVFYTRCPRRFKHGGSLFIACQRRRQQRAPSHRSELREGQLTG